MEKNIHMSGSTGPGTIAHMVSLAPLLVGFMTCMAKMGPGMSHAIARDVSDALGCVRFLLIFILVIGICAFGAKLMFDMLQPRPFVLPRPDRARKMRSADVQFDRPAFSTFVYRRPIMLQTDPQVDKVPETTTPSKEPAEVPIPEPTTTIAGLPDSDATTQPSNNVTNAAELAIDAPPPPPQDASDPVDIPESVKSIEEIIPKSYQTLSKSTRRTRRKGPQH